ncbi:MAG: two-component sensor histidine kinase [Colwellia sp.]|nr:two-component sensor histidine kinase [Colwellia sp.]
MRTLTLSLLIMVLIATLGLSWIFDNFYQQYQQQYLQKKQPSSRATDELSVLEDIGQSIAQALDGLENKQQFIHRWSNNNDRHLSLLELADFPLPEPLMNELISGKTLVLETTDSLAIHYYLTSSAQVLMLTSPVVNVQSKYLLLDIALTSLFYLLMIALMFLWLYPLLKRLVNLRQVAKSFGEGKLEQRIDVGSISYIRDLEIEFNHMAQRIEGLVSDVKLLSNAVSHDLRTPLARIRFGIDTLQEEEDPKLRQCFQDKISDNVDEMSRLVETLLNYARFDQAMINIDKAQINFSALLTRSIAHKEDASIKLSVTMPDEAIYMLGDSNYLMILVANLLQNAQQYCQDEIHVNLHEKGDYIVLLIADDGPGIAPELRDKIIKPFIRGENLNISAQPASIKGYGMGLAIVQRIVDWHHGQLVISRSSELLGAQFSVSLLKYKR